MKLTSSVGLRNREVLMCLVTQGMSAIGLNPSIWMPEILSNRQVIAQFSSTFLVLGELDEFVHFVDDLLPAQLHHVVQLLLLVLLLLSTVKNVGMLLKTRIFSQIAEL